MTVHSLNRISGLLLALMARVPAGEYAARMLRHALSCVCKARAALRRGDVSEAQRLVTWAYGSTRLACGFEAEARA